MRSDLQFGYTELLKASRTVNRNVEYLAWWSSDLDEASHDDTEIPQGDPQVPSDAAITLHDLLPGEGVQVQSVREEYYVNEYSVNMGYGGPEEGGWWYQTGRFIYCHAILADKDEADRKLADLQPYIDEMRAYEYEPESVLCNGWTTIRVERRPGSDYPLCRPVYG